MGLSLGYNLFYGVEMKAFADYLRLDVPARARDQHSRFSELAVLDFLRLLGIAIAVSNRYVTPDTPIWRAFRVPDWRVTLWAPPPRVR